MTKALRGLNLGGWLVAERWMTPHLFEGVKNAGEIALVRELGYDKARARLITHRESFITERDFTWIAEQGFDFVRIPVGYWLFEQTDDFIDGEVYLERAFQWAKRHRLKIILDFHGLQGSQNGQDHSGQVGKVRLYQRRNTDDALRTLEYMCQTYGQEDSLLGIELINEPKVRWFLWRLLSYYDSAYAVAEKHLRPEVKIIVSDAFKPLRVARALSRRGYSDRLVLDIHLYQLFSKRDRQLTFDGHMKKIKDDWLPLLDALSQYQPVMVGEWSAALAGTKGVDERTIAYYKAQRETFDNEAWAHSYWSYKAPDAGAWDYRNQQDFHLK